MSDSFLQSSSTDTFVHLAPPRRIHEVFAQDRKSPSSFPHSFPLVCANISSKCIRREKMLRLVTLPLFCAQTPGWIKPFWSTRLKPQKLFVQPTPSASLHACCRCEGTWCACRSIYFEPQACLFDIGEVQLVTLVGHVLHQLKPSEAH